MEDNIKEMKWTRINHKNNVKIMPKYNSSSNTEPLCKKEIHSQSTIV